MTDIEMRKLVEKARNHIIWIATEVFPEDRTRALDQAYGFVQGIMFAYIDNRALYNMLGDMWIKTGNAIRFNELEKEEI